MALSSTNSTKKGKVVGFTLDNINEKGGLASIFLRGAPGKGGNTYFLGLLKPRVKLYTPTTTYTHIHTLKYSFHNSTIMEKELDAVSNQTIPTDEEIQNTIPVDSINLNDKALNAGGFMLYFKK